MIYSRGGLVASDSLCLVFGDGLCILVNLVGRREYCWHDEEAGRQERTDRHVA